MNTEFLQSEEWLRLQEAAGKETVSLTEDGFAANGIVHTLPLVGKYLYVPRGPQSSIKYQVSSIKYGIQKLIAEAKKRNAKWMRVEPETEEMLEEIKKVVGTLRRAQGGNLRVTKAPHDMQPREIFKIDISLAQELLLVQMKPKTRYNIRLAEKRGVRVFETREEKHIKAFLGLITATSGRKGITAHPRDYYEKFFQVLPQEMCRLFVAQYEDTIIAANLVMFYGDTVTYLHGGTSDRHRDAMAPYLLQWEQIKAAQARGYRYYDFGGVRTSNIQQTANNGEQKRDSWAGITKFKTGFSPNTAPTTFPGSYDIVLDSFGYFLYDALRRMKQWKKLIIH